MSFGQRGGYGGRGGYRGRYGSFNKPVEVGKEYNVSISEVSRRGDGLTRIEGFVVFVPGTKQGQNVRIRITKSLRHLPRILRERPIASRSKAVQSWCWLTQEGVNHSSFMFKRADWCLLDSDE